MADYFTVSFFRLIYPQQSNSGMPQPSEEAHMDLHLPPQNTSFAGADTHPDLPVFASLRLRSMPFRTRMTKAICESEKLLLLGVGEQALRGVR